LALFNKYAASKIPLKTVTLRFMGEELVLVPSQTLVLSTGCDVAVLLPNRSDFDNLPVCIFNEWNLRRCLVIMTRIKEKLKIKRKKFVTNY